MDYDMHYGMRKTVDNLFFLCCLHACFSLLLNQESMSLVYLFPSRTDFSLTFNAIFNWYRMWTFDKPGTETFKFKAIISSYRPLIFVYSEGILNILRREPTYTVKLYDEVLKNLQAEDPQIHKVRGALHSVMRNLLSRFVKPAAMVGKSVDEVQYTLGYNQKVDSELVIGNAAKDFIRDKEKKHLRDHRIVEFYKAARQYFINPCNYIITKLPLNEPVLIHAEIADTDKQSTAKQSSIEFFANRFPVLIPDGATMDTLTEQFVLYQTQDLTTELIAFDRVDEKWNAIGQMKDTGGNLMFNHLAQFCLGILCIPPSSAHCERIFSVVRKNRTDQRASLGDQTLEALLVNKSKPGNPCDEARKHSNATLDESKVPTTIT